ncbi:hypothetical protein BC943DRAFT_214439 [Umbelopsis sp. AD052]|nr:hypothetical protein BC943DRAFT_214439 [Umbelopsis sp. AD052]
MVRAKCLLFPFSFPFSQGLFGKSFLHGVSFRCARPTYSMLLIFILDSLQSPYFLEPAAYFDPFRSSTAFIYFDLLVGLLSARLSKQIGTIEALERTETHIELRIS